MLANNFIRVEFKNIDERTMIFWRQTKGQTFKGNCHVSIW